jgi:GT2 family glycosyltransferase
MPKVSVILVLYNNKQYIKAVLDAVFAQSHKDLEVIAVINSDDGIKAILTTDYPQVKVLDPGQNLGFSGGNNLGIKSSTGDYVQLVNPDLILEAEYIEKILKAFDDQKVAAATGKLLRYDFVNNQKTNIIDSTGVVINSAGRARDRGQLQQDLGQFDDQREVFGVSGAGPMYRRSALDRVRFGLEYLDEDFFAYWEDVDLSWRLNNAGFRCVYVPQATAYHGRTAGQSEGGYAKIWNFYKHHKKLSARIRQLNYKNHILMYIKNARFIFHPAFVVRELAMLGYILLFETSTLGVLPQLFRQLPKIWAKRKARQNLASEV